MCCGCNGYDSESDPDLTDLDTDSDTDSLEDITSSSQSSDLSEVPGKDGVADHGGDTHTSDKQPAAKRARADQGSDTGTAPGAKDFGTKKKILDPLFTVPIDILLEIFGHLEPLDLLRLFRTHKAFRQVLSSNHAASVWKAARVNRGGVPDCVPGMSEIEWAELLFNNSCCEECGKKGIWRIDFGLRRRICRLCLNEDLVCDEAFSYDFPEYDPIILDFIPFSSIRVDDHDHNDCRMFWPKDIERMAKELEPYLKPGAEQALEDFKQSRKKYIDSNIDHISICDAWTGKDNQRRLERARQLRDQNSELFVARLIALGHNAKDVKRMFDRRHYGILDKELTDARWKRLIPKVEYKLAELQEEWRLQRQSEVSFLRQSRLLTLYNKYVLPLPQGIIPPVADFLKLSDVAEFIKSPRAEDGASDYPPCDAFAERIPEFYAEYMNKRKLELTRLLALSADAVQDTTTPQSQGIEAPDDMLMQLATSIVQCTHPRSQALPLITWDKVQHHRFHDRGMAHSYELSAATSPCIFSISERGVAAARSLLTLVGLNAQTTTATTMDSLQCRFFCSNCSPKSENGGTYRMAMDWRQGVFHYVQERSPSHKEPHWELLSAAQLQVVQSCPAPEYPVATERVWRCNHCILYRNGPATKPIVIKHTRSHVLKTPIEGTDFSYDQCAVEEPPPATKFFVTPQTRVPDNSTYRCQHCNRSTRTFKLQGVKAHLKAKHKIIYSSEGPDFSRIE
ncbi:uncharacterized protein EDB93DRAFT_210913 [Suillus bovinus]|uniref:uncharacterized protein n=1 Tax=Suillus bovinus TaxID=48563 RepID=UPI001B86F0C8|nr:uncharacterized protein EDB93DRAFT_210913 [Suillus bovinus]KAG2153723.1 hypothetical protein EDB93DRAFT_210913 [Suillus bovinus]